MPRGEPDYLNSGDNNMFLILPCEVMSGGVLSSRLLMAGRKGWCPEPTRGFNRQSKICSHSRRGAQYPAETQGIDLVRGWLKWWKLGKMDHTPTSWYRATQ